MVKLQLTHIKNKLNETLTGLIDISDHQNKPEPEKQKVLLSISQRYRNRRKRFGLRCHLIAGIYNYDLQKAN